MTSVGDGRREREAEREQAALYRLMAERTSDYLSIERADHTIVYASPSVERLLGYRPDEIVGTMARDLVHPTDLQRARIAIGTALETDDTFTYEMRVRHKEGRYVWVEVTGQSILLADGATGRIVSTRDIARRKAAEATLRATEGIFRAVVRQSTDLIIVAGTEEVLYASPSTRDVFGVDLHGRPLRDLIPFVHPDSIAATIARFGEIWAQPGHHRASEITMRSRDEWRVFELTATNLMEEPTIGGVVFSGRDITERRSTELLLLENERRMHALELERHEERVAEQVRRAQQMDTVGRLAAGAAHDFGNLLGVVANCSRYVARQLDPEHPAVADLAVIDDAVARAADLIQQLLLFGTPPIATASRFDVASSTTETLAMLSGPGEPPPDLVHIARAEPLEVIADRRRIERALINVVVNARAANPAGGVVRVRTERADVGAHHATELGIEPGSYARITVRDEGPGMTPEVLDRAFEPFFTTSMTPSGTGLGLSTAKDAVERAGGAIALSSRSGEGTTATILLPLAPPQPP